MLERRPRSRGARANRAEAVGVAAVQEQHDEAELLHRPVAARSGTRTTKPEGCH